MMLAVSLLLFAGAVAYVVYPLLRPGHEGPTVSSRARKLAELNLQKEAVYSSIRDLDFDFRMGKLPEEEHDRLIRDYKVQAASILAAVDRLAGDDRKGRQSVAPGSRSASPEAGVLACPGCRAEYRPADAFCAHCGRRLGRV